jgi:hypothetical protein
MRLYRLRKIPSYLRAQLVAQGFSLGSSCRKCSVCKGASQLAEKAIGFVFGRERRASALRNAQQIQGALAPGLLFVAPQSLFFRNLFSPELRFFVSEGTFSAACLVAEGPSGGLIRTSLKRGFNGD